MKYFSVILVFSVLILGFSDPSHAVERIKFAPGATSTQVSGVVKNYDTLTYMLSARAGQTLKLKLDSKNRFLYFNVLDASLNELKGGPPGGTATEWSGTLPKDGTYQIIVFLMRPEAQRGATANFVLHAAIPQ